MNKRIFPVVLGGVVAVLGLTLGLLVPAAGASSPYITITSRLHHVPGYRPNGVIYTVCNRRAFPPPYYTSAGISNDYADVSVRVSPNRSPDQRRFELGAPHSTPHCARIEVRQHDHDLTRITVHMRWIRNGASETTHDHRRVGHRKRPVT